MEKWILEEEMKHELFYLKRAEAENFAWAVLVLYKAAPPVPVDAWEWEEASEINGVDCTTLFQKRIVDYPKPPQTWAIKKTILVGKDKLSSICDVARSIIHHD